jgi:hypothetical protein
VVPIVAQSVNQSNGTSLFLSGGAQEEALLHFFAEGLVPDCTVPSNNGNADLIHVGDTFWNGYYPFIDYSTGGSIDGMIQATEANLAKISNDTSCVRQVT